MSSATPSSGHQPYLFRVPKDVSSPLRRYTMNRTVLTLVMTLAWCAVVIPVFVMDVFDLNPHVAFSVIFMLALVPLVHFCASVLFLNGPSQALAETVVSATGQRLLVQDVNHAIKKAFKGSNYLAPGLAAGGTHTMKNGIRFSSKEREWLVRLAPDLSSGTIVVTALSGISPDSQNTEAVSARYVNNAVIMLPEDILKRRKTSVMQFLGSVFALITCGIILAFNQSYMPPDVVLLFTCFGALGMGKLLKKPLMGDSTREVSEFITVSLNQSAAFNESLALALNTGTFRRMTSSGFAGLMTSVELLEVLIEPPNEPAWVISELMNAKGYRLQRSDGRSIQDAPEDKRLRL